MRKCYLTRCQTGASFQLLELCNSSSSSRKCTRTVRPLNHLHFSQHEILLIVARRFPSSAQSPRQLFSWWPKMVLCCCPRIFLKITCETLWRRSFSLFDHCWIEPHSVECCCALVQQLTSAENCSCGIEWRIVLVSSNSLSKRRHFALLHWLTINMRVWWRQQPRAQWRHATPFFFQSYGLSPPAWFLSAIGLHRGGGEKAEFGKVSSGSESFFCISLLLPSFIDTSHTSERTDIIYFPFVPTGRVIRSFPR